MKCYKKIGQCLAVLSLVAMATSCTRTSGVEGQETSETKIDHLIIKEIFYVGHDYHLQNTYTKKWNPEPYKNDQYIVIYNPTDEIKYLDGLALATHSLDPMVSRDFDPSTDFRNKYYGISGLAVFPVKNETGKSLPIVPGDSVIVAAYAVNHAQKLAEKMKRDEENDGEEYPIKGQEDLFDLSKANFEWTDVDFLNEDGRFYNNPNVPDMHPIGYTEKDSRLKFSETLSESMGLALVEVPWKWEYFRDKQNPDPKTKWAGITHEFHVRNGASGGYATEIPFDKVIDAVTICPRQNGLFKSKLSDKVDKGYQGVTELLLSNTSHKEKHDKYYGVSIARKWDGRKFVDDNNSTQDFEIIYASQGKKRGYPEWYKAGGKKKNNKNEKENGKKK